MKLLALSSLILIGVMLLLVGMEKHVESREGIDLLCNGLLVVGRAGRHETSETTTAPIEPEIRSS